MGGDIAKLPEIVALAKKYGARVMVDDAPCERPDYQLRDGQVISVRGYGRAQYLGVDGQSKKGKDVVRIALYS